MLRRLARTQVEQPQTFPSQLAVVLFRSAPVGLGGDEAGNRYLKQGAPCDRCVTALWHEGALRTVGLRDQRQPLIVTETREVLVQSDAADALLDKVATHELALGRVMDADTGNTLSYRQLLPQVTLPQATPESTAMETDHLGPPCPVCRRDGRFGRRAKDRIYCYRASEAPAGEVFSTWEHFGNSRTHKNPIGNHAAPHVVAGPALLSWFRGAKVPHALVPIHFV